MIIIGIIYDGTIVYYKWNVKDDKGIYPLMVFPEHNLGNTVFLTREEVEKANKRRLL